LPCEQATNLVNFFDKVMLSPHAPPVLRARCNGTCCAPLWAGADNAPCRLPGIYDAERGALVDFTRARMGFKHSEGLSGAYDEMPTSLKMLTWLEDHEFHGARGRVAARMPCEPARGSVRSGAAVHSLSSRQTTATTSALLTTYPNLSTQGSLTWRPACAACP